MSHHCDPSEELKTKTGELNVALAGNPNSGKTTVFNALTGMRQKVANYPGVTVEKKIGRCKLPGGSWASIIDLPGAYSMISRSPDEQVAMEVLRGLRPETPLPDVVVVVVDASNLYRNLYFVSQLVELGLPLVVALNMTDIAQRRGIGVDADKLSNQIGVPVVPMVGHKSKGIDALKSAIERASIPKMPDWPLPEVMRHEISAVSSAVNAACETLRTSSEGKSTVEKKSAWRSTQNADRRTVLAERLLIGDHASDLDEITAIDSIRTAVNSSTNRLKELGIDPMQADIEAHYRWIDGVVHASMESTTSAIASAHPDSTQPLQYESRPERTLTQKVDSILIHKFWGLLIFALIMASLFVSLFWVAKPIMEGLQKCLDYLSNICTMRMSDGPIKDLVQNGIFKGVGTVVLFVPQIAMLFLFLSILEDSGYLARAAFLMDRLFAKLGLHGKSFIPLLSSFACAIPGIMATRTIENRKDRLATILIAPFMSCSARLPVYTLLIGTCFVTLGPLAQAGVMLACYAVGILAAAGTAFVFKQSFQKTGPSSFILEMPSYKVPQLSQVGRSVWSNTRAFITKAGTTILLLCIVLWAMTYYPRLPETRKAAITLQVESAPFQAWDPALYDSATPPTKDEVIEKAIAGAQSEYSIAGRFGHAIEPVIKPLGFDWKMGVGLVGAFAAREAFVGTMGIVYSVGKVEVDATKDLATAMRNDRYANGKPVWTPLVAASLLVWFVLAMQCMSTVAIVRRETGGWAWPIFMIVYMNGLAYVASLAVFQIGRLVFQA